MKALHILAFSVVALARANAAEFVYQAVPYVLTHASTGTQYTVNGTFTTDCNDCDTSSGEGPNIIDWQLHVDGPNPFTFTPSTSDLINDDFIATPASLSLSEFYLVTFNYVRGGQDSYLSYSFNPSTIPNSGEVEYFNNLSGFTRASAEGLSVDGSGRFVIGTFVPEPNAFVLGTLSFVGLAIWGRY